MTSITKQLIKDCKSGDRLAQKKLYLLTKERLKNISWRYCYNIHDAQDVVQNAYFKIFKSLHQYDIQKGNFRAWSNKIVVNEALQLIRKRKKLSFKSVTTHDEKIYGTTELNMDSFTIDDILKVMQHLKSPQLLIFNMFFIDEYSYKEIASQFEIEESSARSKVSRAKKAFLTIWTKYDKTIAL